MKFIYFFIPGAILLFGFIACDDNNPTPENPEELITTIRLTFRDVATQTEYVQLFQDEDGDGGNPPTITTEPIPSNSVFITSVELLNEASVPAEDITEEVREEGAEHQFFFILSDTINLTHSYEDVDINGNPIGILNSMVSGDPSTGNLQLVLRHALNKFNIGVSAGDITNAGGETDVDVAFELEIE